MRQLLHRIEIGFKMLYIRIVLSSVRGEIRRDPAAAEKYKDSWSWLVINRNGEFD